MEDIRNFLASPTGERLLRWAEEDADRQIAVGIGLAGGLILSAISR